MPDNPFDVHCSKCQLVIVPAEKMLLLWNVSKQERNADDLRVPHVGDMVIMNADFICPKCGSKVYFRLSEQKLDRILRQIKYV